MLVLRWAFALVLFGLFVCVPQSANAQSRPDNLLRRERAEAAIAQAVARHSLSSASIAGARTRARWAGLLPQLSVRLLRGAMATSVTSDPLSDPTTVDDSLRVDVRALWQLDRLVFDPAETSLFRLEAELQERRRNLEKEVVEILSAMQRTRAQLERAAPGSQEFFQSELEWNKHRLQLEILTGSSFEATVVPIQH